MDDPGPSSRYYAAFPTTADGPVRPPSPSQPIVEAGVDPMSETTNESFYAMFNLPTSASEAEIRDRYRTLAATFHPDRQRDQASRDAAHGRFTEIQRAYEVLTDPTKRTIYDMFGEEGLKTSWEIGPRNRTPEELRRHFAQQAYEKKRLDAEALVKPKGDMSLVLDARAVFLSRRFFKDPSLVKHDPVSRIARTRPGQLLMKHSFEVPVSPKTQLIWAGQMVSRGRAGGGNVLGTVRHTFSPQCWGEIGTSFLEPRIVTGKGTYTFDEHTYATVNAQQHMIAAPPMMTVQLGRRVYQNTTGFITLKTGYWSLPLLDHLVHPDFPLRREKSALSVGLTTSRRDGSGWTVETQAGLMASHIAGDWSTKIWGVRLKFGAAMGSTGVNAFVDGEGRVTSNTRLGCMVSVEFGGGVTMRWRFSRLGQAVSIPILLSPTLAPAVVLGSTLIPAASYAALYHFYLMPRKKRRIAERVKELREEHADFIVQKRTEAQEAVKLLERSVAQNICHERAKSGLIIISAQYGRAANFTARGIKHDAGEEEMIIDVTVPVQALVNESKLFIPGGRAKFNILGFWDPCIGEGKKLRIRYLFRDKMHEVTVDDVAPLRAPLRAHALDKEE